MSSLFLVLQAPVTGAIAAPQIEAQAHNGLRLWLKHFDTIVAACPHYPDFQEPTLPISSVDGADRLRILCLEQAWSPHRFAKKLPAASRVLASEIDKAKHLSFAIGGLWGDWASIAALIASSKKRAYSVWTDRVESDVHFARAQKKKNAAALYAKMTAQLMSRYERAIIRRAALGLFHGADCFEMYAGHCKNSHMVHNVHIGPEQHISSKQLSERLSTSRSGPLRIVYAGKASPEKGILDWVEAIALASKKIDIEATWFGDGTELEIAKQKASKTAANIRFARPLPHYELLQALKTYDAFVFCHKTLESPRCLIEALACGLPIVGYQSSYPSDLLKQHGGGLLTPQNSPEDLSNALTRLSDKELLGSLSTSAAMAGSQFTDERVFSHRAHLIKAMSFEK